MGSRLLSLFQYIWHLLRAGNQHNLHSPFLYKWYMQVIKNNNGIQSPETPEIMRSEFLQNQNEVRGQDYGAGSKKSGVKRVCDYAGIALSPKWQYEILYRMAKVQNPKLILELGTCLGVGTAWLAHANSSPVISIEGNAALFQEAGKSIAKHKLENIELINGRFSEHLEKIAKKADFPWFTYIDGDHTEKGTLNYFETLLSYVKQDCIMVFDDIYWSRGMTRAWKKICKDSRVPLSLDFHHFGVVIFRDNQPKQHFRLLI